MSDPFHVEGERLPASRFRLGPAQHRVRVAHLTGMHICGRKRNRHLTCAGERGGGGQSEVSKAPDSAGSVYFHIDTFLGVVPVHFTVSGRLFQHIFTETCMTT